MKNPKTILFDGDGTLWRPTGQASDDRPDTIYNDDLTSNKSHLHVSLIDGVSQMLANLHEQGHQIYIISAHPSPSLEALDELKTKIDYLGIADYIDGYYRSDGENRDGKTVIIQNIIGDFSIEPSNVYMVGDSYYYDYEAGIDAGVNSFFLKNNYCNQPSPLPEGTVILNDVTDIANIIHLK